MRLITTVILLYSSLMVGYGQCLSQDHHNSSFYSAWMSCEPRPNPFTGQGPPSHWIIYQFPSLTEISSMSIWNINTPEYLSSGAKTIEIISSFDSYEWTRVDTISVSLGVGDMSYIGEDVPDFKGVKANYLMLNILENHGGSCFGFAEVKFNLGQLSTPTDEVAHFDVSIWPNPVMDNTKIKISGMHTQRINYRLVDMAGRELLQGIENPSGADHQFSISSASLASGTYNLQIITDEGSKTEKLVVFKRQ